MTVQTSRLGSVCQVSEPQPQSLPAADAGTPVWQTWLAGRTTDMLASAREQVAALKTERPRDTTALLERWNDINIALSNALAAASLFQQVHPDAAIRELAEAAEVEGNELVTELSLDREIYDLLVVDDADPVTTGLDDAAERVRNFALRDFRRAGVDRDEATRDRVRALNAAEVEASQTFERNIRDDTSTISLESGQLAGLPQDWVDAHPVGEDGRVELTTEYPDVIPMLQFGTDREARRAVQSAFNNRAWPVNDAVLAGLLELRREHATMLGYDGWPSYDAEVKMIETGAAIPAFVEKISAASEVAALADRATLLARIQQEHPDADTVDAADVNFYLETLRRELHDVDSQEVRRYFAFDKVRAGLLEVTGRLFGVTYEEVSAPTWHADVTAYDVSLGGERLGRIHLDLHPRPNKFNHAAQFTLTEGVTDRQLPEGVLVCNFPRGLMEHRDVVTLFHEFGHLLHHVLGGHQRWVRFSGVATEWDFVEAPSQLLEEWAWDAEVLAGFATDESGTPIPADLVARMRNADDFARALQTRTQMFYAALSYELHQDPPPDITARSRELQATYSMISPRPDTHFHTSFGHLSGYASGYYTYMWSLVIAKDLFSAFDPTDLYDAEVASRYRDRLLAQGGSKDAADLVEDFLGRPFGFDSFARWLAGE
jgi:thimet oligopeptidase